MNLREIIIILLTLLVLANFRAIAMSLIEAINTFKGGPRPPTHPLPSTDSRILNRRRPHSQET